MIDYKARKDILDNASFYVFLFWINYFFLHQKHLVAWDDNDVTWKKKNTHINYISLQRGEINIYKRILSLCEVINIVKWCFIYSKCLYQFTSLFLSINFYKSVYHKLPCLLAHTPQYALLCIQFSPLENLL